MPFDPNNVPIEYLIQPELLSELDILNILKARYVRVDNMENFNKEQLLNLFYRVITPKQQRTNNRRSTGSQSEQNENTTNKKFKKTHNENSVIFNGNLAKNGNSNAAKIQIKRSYSSENKIEEPVIKKGRQRICWP